MESTKLGSSETTGSAPPAMSLVGALALAEQYRSSGRLAEAELLCQDVLNTWPNEARALHLLGLIAYQSGRLSEAIDHLGRAVAANPRVALFNANLGEMYRRAGRLEEAVAAARRAIALAPDYPEALSNLGAALYDQKKFKEATACHRRAIDLKPDFALAHRNLGNALLAIKRHDKAIASYRQAITLDPNFTDAWSNLGTALQLAGHYSEAADAFRRAIRLEPNHADAHSGLGIVLLMQGDFAAGWEHYEWRLKSAEAKIAYVPQRPWNGENLAGQTIYVQGEQGFGDTIQFVRYLAKLKARGASVSVRVQQSLLTLLRDSLPGIEVLGDGDAPFMTPDWDCALLSLPRLFATRLDTIPAEVPYLRAPAVAAQHWRDHLAAMPGVKAGVVWAGRPEHINDFRRSLELAALAPVFKVPGISFGSLQVGPRAADLKRHRTFKIIDLSPKLVDFAETAGAIAALDLLITVDTSVAHLAGALGKPVWLLLPWVTDWRWLIGRDDSPWYPTMRLYRQQEGQSWSDVVKAVATDLKAVAKGDRSRLTPFSPQ